MARNAPLSLRMFKELAYRGQGMGESEIAALTRVMYDRLLVSEDAKEGPRAFAEKRAPQWHGK
jgi:enoyl-CoA hydratase